MDSLIKKIKPNKKNMRMRLGGLEKVSLAPKLSGCDMLKFFQMPVKNWKLPRKYHILCSFSSAISTEIISF